MSCFPNLVYKPKHIHDNNLVMDSWSVNDYQVKADTYAEDGGLRISGSNKQTCTHNNFENETKEKSTTFYL